MPRVDVLAHCPVPDSFRVKAVSGMFDVPLSERAEVRFSVDLPAQDEDWQIGVIVGPSGSGKSTVAREAFGDNLYAGEDWRGDVAVVDCFPKDCEVKSISQMLTAVGFSSPPSWVKPYPYLSNGERFRCDLARALLAPGNLVVFDEYTSVVDRTVAKIGSAAVSKSLRQRMPEKRFVAVTCHYDVVEWLEPDWVLDMATSELARGRLRRPPIEVEIVRCHHSAWSLFKKHHYLTASLNKAAVCFLSLVDGQPAGFCSWLPFVGKQSLIGRSYRGHRQVVLPDYQGVGIGGAVFNANAALFAGMGYTVRSCTAHPAEIRSRLRSKIWRMTRAPSRNSKGGGRSEVGTRLQRTRAADRLTASFLYVGPKLERREAERFLEVRDDRPRRPRKARKIRL